MSANNYLVIRDINKPHGDYKLTEHDADTGKQIGEIIAKSSDLKKIIKIATKEMWKVEYGLHFNI